jgi:hypothetical protein
LKHQQCCNRLRQQQLVKQLDAPSDMLALPSPLQERCEPGVCKVARYHGPLVLELKPEVPGVSRASAERFKPGPACPGFQPAWEGRQCSGDVELLAGDGSCQRVHKLVLQCRLPVLQGQPVAAEVEQVSCWPAAAAVQQQAQPAVGQAPMDKARAAACCTYTHVTYKVSWCS